MTAEIQQYLAQVLPMLAKAAISWGVLGAGLGVIAALVLALGLRLMGAWRVPAGRSLWIRRLCVAWFVGGTAVGFALAFGAVGSYQGLFQAAKEAPQAEQVLGTISTVAVDTSMAFLVRVGETETIHPAEGKAVTVEVAEAVRSGVGEVPVQDVRAAVNAFDRAMKEDTAPQVAQAVVSAVKAAAPTEARRLVGTGAQRMTDTVRQGLDVRSLDPALATAWAALDRAAATSGDAAALSREEIGTLVIDRLALPMLLRPTVVAIAPVAVLGALLCPVAWVPPLLLLWWLRRRETGKDEEPLEGVHAIR